MNKFLANLFTNADDLEKTYRISSWLFIRLIALIYLAAFLSMSVQITGLVGMEGILPVSNYLDAAEQALGTIAWLRLPTVFWLNASDNFLLLTCYAGAVISLLLFFGRYQLFASITLFILYLSIYHAGQTFLNFQWDYLLLEAGFLTILLTQSNNRLVIFLFHWLLFRLRFLSGISKTSDPSWTGLTTLDYYFETQPLPHLGAWYFHQLPDWLLRFGTGFTLFIEIIVPFFIFLPRRFRLFAALSTITWQLLIIASSNHNWLNLLTIALCLFLLDDKLMSSVTPRKLAHRLFQQKISATAVTHALTLFAGIVIVTTSIAIATQVFANQKMPSVFSWIRAYGLGNAYHVFPTMQTERYEFIIEGSHDGRQWLPYTFKYKPNSVYHMPDFIVPHQPRLDWMIWFIPPQAPDMRYWFDRFIEGLHENNPEITNLLADNPFKQKAPRYVRVMTYRFTFTDSNEHKRNGTYWKAQFLGPFPFVPPRRP